MENIIFPIGSNQLIRNELRIDELLVPVEVINPYRVINKVINSLRELDNHFRMCFPLKYY